MNNNLTKSVSIPDGKVDSQKETILFSNDQMLWKAFKAGNSSAFILIYEKYFDALFSYGIRIHCDEELVKDAIQDIFLHLKSKSQSLGDTDHIKFYLFKCLKRRILKELKNWTDLKDESGEQRNFEVTFSHEQNLIDKQFDLEKSKKINDAIKSLSPRKREAIYYIYFEGLSYQQVSELMELSDSKSARDLVYKALKCLRNSLGFLPLCFISYAT
jgi:RNA polymerase sigma factor (sigma-70 family)